ncbi:MAG: hypothetical protein KF865_00585 [Bdellovibrionaceae bacterium]|nr:hypothetical protein [Pseudobdellovibrionaceae bacterium]
MKTVFDHYSHIWPGSRLESLKPILKGVYCLHYPAESVFMPEASKKKSIIIIDGPCDHNFSWFLAKGFEHVIHKEREDFVQELLASALMIVRPETFSKNPLPFFFTGFQAPAEKSQGERSLILEFRESREKQEIKEHLGGFFEAIPNLRFVSDLAMQVADEMFSNVLHNAPMLPGGNRPYAGLPRSEKIVLPAGQKARLFASYSDQRIIVGCEDPFGSLQREPVLNRLVEIYGESHDGRPVTSPGLGMKLMIDNAANFYLYAERGAKTLIACAFLVGGKRANMTAAKHIHFSVL